MEVHLDTVLHLDCLQVMEAHQTAMVVRRQEDMEVRRQEDMEVRRQEDMEGHRQDQDMEDGKHRYFPTQAFKAISAFTHLPQNFSSFLSLMSN
jgi:hypothetical protein